MEVEIKIPLEEPVKEREIITQISDRFGEPTGTIIQNDTYYQSPIRNFAQTDEALRIRCIKTGLELEKVEITYKGPKEGSNLKIRDEITLDVQDQKNAKQFLENLGFQEFAEVKKQRTNWHQRDLTVSFDKVLDLGLYVEVEITTKDDLKETINQAKERIVRIANEVIPNYKGQDERKSYLELLIQKQLK